MFVLRGIAVSLAFFVVLYCVLSMLVAFTWRSLRVLRLKAQSLADGLFMARIFPLVGAAAMTLAFVVPSFQILEPRSIDEGMGAMPLALGICALLLIACGCFRVIAALAQTSRVVGRWAEGARALKVDTEPVTLQSSRLSPPLALVGVHKPRVLVSEKTVALLNSDELHIALKHELAHMRSHDNLKKLICNFCPFPGMGTLESAWAQAAEMAADDAAVSKLDDAVDLAAALVKLSRLMPVEAAPVCTVGFVTGSISARVVRLLAWDAAGNLSKTRPGIWYVVPAFVFGVFFLIASYSPALALTHEITEWLVR